MAKVTNLETNKTKEVKNLGWLRNNWQQIQSFEVVKNKPGSMYDCVLKAHCFKNDVKSIYETDFASFSICLDFLDRPIFRLKDLKLVLHDKTEKNYNIGDIEYEKLKQSTHY